MKIIYAIKLRMPYTMQHHRSKIIVKIEEISHLLGLSRSFDKI